MNAMSREKMIQYLRDYANIQILVGKNPNIPIGKIFDTYMIQNGRYEDDTREYYDRMRRVYKAYNYFKEFSIIEDFLLNRDDYLSNSDLNGIESDCQFIIKPSNITNKKVVQLIRDAFNHNDLTGIDKFKISENGKYFEIEFLDIRTEKEKIANVPEKPIKIKFNVKYLNKVYKIINEKRQNQLFLSFEIPDDFNIYANNLDNELDKIKFIHYYFDKKMSKDTTKEFSKFQDFKDLSIEEKLNISKELHTFAKSIKEPLTFDLDTYQKRKLKELINRYRNNYKELLNERVNAIMFYFLSKVIPVPGIKLRDIENQIILCEEYFEDVNLCLNEVTRRLLRILNDEKKPSYYDDIDSDIHDFMKEKGYTYSRNFYQNLLDGEFVQLYPIITYIDSVILHYCTEKEIEIAGKVYEKEKIRNCLAHGRWYISKDFKLTMYDADPRNINDYKLEFIGKIDIELFKEWADDYMDSINRVKKR